MFNFGWGVFFVLVNFALFLVCYRLFGKQGLYAWVAAAVILANIQVVKTFEMFGYIMTLGNTMYATIYLTTDLINEKYGEKDARRAVWFGFFILIMTTVIMQMVLKFEPSEVDVAQPALKTIFELMPQIAAASLTAYLISQFLDVKLFSRIRVKFPSKGQLWIRNIGSTAVSQMVDTLIFCSIAFYGMYEWSVWWEIAITTYVLKFVISAASTPVIYWARSFKFKDDEQKA